MVLQFRNSIVDGAAKSHHQQSVPCFTVKP